LDLGETLSRAGEQENGVACFLLGYKLSNGDTLGYLQGLSKNESLAVQQAGDVTLKKIQSVAANTETKSPTGDSATNSPAEDQGGSAATR